LHLVDLEILDILEDPVLLLFLADLDTLENQ
jgi:hypothetical protein